MTFMPRAWPSLTNSVVKSWQRPGWGGTFPPWYQAYPLQETAKVWMTFAPSPAYQATCCSGSASAQSPGGAKPLGPPGPQLKSMQKARIASPARRAGLPVCQSRTAAHKTAPRINRLRIGLLCLAGVWAPGGRFRAWWALAGAVSSSPDAGARFREKLIPADSKAETVGQALVPAPLLKITSWTNETPRFRRSNGRTNHSNRG